MGNKVRISPIFLPVFAVMVLLLPLKWLFAMILAAIFHEFCHWTVIRLLGGSVRFISLGQRGVKMYMDGLSPGEAALCALGGPVGSFLLVLLGNYFPRLAFCGAVQGLYNLLPIPPMDGWRILQVLLPKRWVEFFTYIFVRGFPIFILLLGIYATFIKKMGLLPLLLCMFLCFRVLDRPFLLLTKYGRRSRMSLPGIHPGN